MYIDLGTHVITNDEYNFILNVKLVDQTGKAEGKVYLRAIKYYNSLERLCHEVPTQVTLSDTDSNSLADLNTSLTKYITTLKEMLNVK